MTTQDVTLSLPENIYLRLQQVAQATQSSFSDVLLHAIQVGSPPDWETAPAEFQLALATLDRLDDDSLWKIAREQQPQSALNMYQDLLDKNANANISQSEREKLERLRFQADQIMLQKAQAAAILQWRGHQIPPAEKL